MSSFVISTEELMKKASPEYNEMNDITAATIYAVPAPSIKALIPPPLELAEPALLTIYVSNINKPTFTAPYIEGGIAVSTKFTDSAGTVHNGLYYFSLQLCGAGAQNATFMGREEAGLPKKFANTIGLKRVRDDVFFHVERNGVKLLDARLKIGSYNDLAFSNGLENLNSAKGMLKQDGVLTHRYNMSNENGLHNMSLYYYNSSTFYNRYEPAYAKIKLQSSKYDPWGEIKIVKVLGGSWARNNNIVVDVTKIHSYPDAEAMNIMQYLYTGRFDPLVGRR